MPDAGEITQLLQMADQGHGDAANRLYELVEPDLRQIARKRRRAAGVGPGVDASTTLLVDEAFYRLVGRDATSWLPGDRRKFFAYTATKVHDFLIDELRKQQAAKRGGDRQQAELIDQPGPAGPVDPLGDLDMLIDLRDALGRLQGFSPDDANVFRLRFFLDCTFAEIADLLGTSESAAKRGYQHAQLWLRRELKEYERDA